MCSECARSTFSISESGRIHASQFCVGDGGCVCIGFCESSSYSDLVQLRMCDEEAVSSAAMGGWSHATSQIIAAAIALTAAIVLVLSIWLWRRGRRCRVGRMTRREMLALTRAVLVESAKAEAWAIRAQDRSRPPREPQMGPPLQLTGWWAQQDELIARETADSSALSASGSFFLTPPSSASAAFGADGLTQSDVVKHERRRGESRTYSI